MKANRKLLIFLACGMTFFMSFMYASAATSADVFSGGFLSAGSLKYAMENYGATNSEATTAIAQWNGVSSKVKITHSNVSNSHIKLSTGRLAPPYDGALGLTKLTNGSLEVSTTQTWSHALCIRYNSPYLNTTAKKIETLTHEIGHALSMAHCTSTAHNCRMQQGVQTSYALAAHDKEKLKYKWGN